MLIHVKNIMRLIRHFEPVIDTFCDDCKSRLHTNPMRILDCKIDRDKEAVKMRQELLIT